MKSRRDAVVTKINRKRARAQKKSPRRRRDEGGEKKEVPSSFWPVNKENVTFRA